jgi:hypothetical protein
MRPSFILFALLVISGCLAEPPAPVPTVPSGLEHHERVPLRDDLLDLVHYQPLDRSRL